MTLLGWPLLSHERFDRRFRVWIALGVGAFAAVIAIYFLMVAKLLSVSGA
jgi:uncharacterized membrane protein